jgi:hypothetical protein
MQLQVYDYNEIHLEKGQYSCLILCVGACVCVCVCVCVWVRERERCLETHFCDQLCCQASFQRKKRIDICFAIKSAIPHWLGGIANTFQESNWSSAFADFKRSWGGVSFSAPGVRVIPQCLNCHTTVHHIKPFETRIKCLACSERDENLKGFLCVARSWAMTLGDSGTSSAHWMSAMVNFWLRVVVVRLAVR